MDPVNPVGLRLAPPGAPSPSCELPRSGARRTPGHVFPGDGAAFRGAAAPPRAPRPVLHRIPAPPPAPASRKLRVHSPAFFESESCRFAASPKGGVYEAERYKYGRCTLSTPRRQEEPTGTTDR